MSLKRKRKPAADQHNMPKFLEFKYRQLLYLPAIPAHEVSGFSLKKQISSGKMANMD